MAQEIEKLSGDTIVQEKRMPIDAIKDNFSKRKADFASVLPSHITFEKFQRTVLTACVANPDLMKADRQSLMLSAIKAATDGLLPDGRDAALVIFNSKDGKDEQGKDRWIQRVQYMPMYAGILKKVRNSGEISSVVAHVVYDIEVKKGLFKYILGDEERIEHSPYMGDEELGEVAAAYCIAKLKDGSIIREVMTRAEIERVRKTSKSGNDNGNPKGIWKDWYSEMARKTVFRRCAKWLPQNIEIAGTVFDNDDTMDTFDNVAPDEATYGDKPQTETEKKAEGQDDDQSKSVEEDKPKQLTDESGQPDLKTMIDQAKAKEGEKVLVEGQNLEQSAPVEKKAAAVPADQKLPIFDQIKNDLTAAPSIKRLNELWDDVYAEILANIYTESEDAYNELSGVKNARRKELEKLAGDPKKLL